jgi:hypothetical protein
VAHVISDCHPITATAADNQSLQQCRSFTGRALAPVTSYGLRALMKPLLILFVIFPRQIAGVGSVNQGLPFFPRDRHDSGTAIDSLSTVVPPKHIGTGIPRIV